MYSIPITRRDIDSRCTWSQIDSIMPSVSVLRVSFRVPAYPFCFFLDKIAQAHHKDRLYGTHSGFTEYYFCNFRQVWKSPRTLLPAPDKVLVCLISRLECTRYALREWDLSIEIWLLRMVFFIYLAKNNIFDKSIFSFWSLMTTSVIWHKWSGLFFYEKWSIFRESLFWIKNIPFW